MQTEGMQWLQVCLPILKKFLNSNFFDYYLSRNNIIWQPDPDPIGGYPDKRSISNPVVLGDCVYFYSLRSSSIWKFEFPTFTWRRAHTLVKLDTGATLSLRCVAGEDKAALLVLVENDETVLIKCEIWTFSLKQDWYAMWAVLQAHALFFAFYETQKYDKLHETYRLLLLII